MSNGIQLISRIVSLCLGVGGASKTHKSSLHAIASILRQEGFFGVYNGLVCLIVKKKLYNTTVCLTLAAILINNESFILGCVAIVSNQWLHQQFGLTICCFNNGGKKQTHFGCIVSYCILDWNSTGTF